MACGCFGERLPTVLEVIVQEGASIALFEEYDSKGKSRPEDCEALRVLSTLVKEEALGFDVTKLEAYTDLCARGRAALIAAPSPIKPMLERMVYSLECRQKNSQPLTEPERQSFAALVAKIKGDRALSIIDQKMVDYVLEHHPDFCRRQANTDAGDVWMLEFVKHLKTRSHIDVFFKAPNESGWISTCHIEKESGLVAGQHREDVSPIISMEKFHGVEKVALKVDGEYRAISGPENKKVICHLKNVDATKSPLQVTIAQIFEYCRLKAWSYPPIEFSADRGIINQSSIDFRSATNKIDSTGDPILEESGLPSLEFDQEALPDIRDVEACKKFISEQLPLSYTMTTEELQVLYPTQKIPKDQVIYLQRANRRHKDLSVRDSHGFFEIALPIEGGKYKMISIGWQPLDLPQTSQGFISQFTSAQKAGIHVPDQGVKMPREQLGWLIGINEAEFGELCTYIVKEVSKARRGETFFIWQGTNCAYLAWKFYMHIIGKKAISDLEDLAVKYSDGTKTRHDIHKLLRYALYYFHDEKLVEVLDDLLPKMLDVTKINPSEIEKLVKGMGDLLVRTVFKDSDEEAPLKKAMLGQLRELNEKSVQLQASGDLRAVMTLFKNELYEFIKLTMKSQQFYRSSIYEAQYSGILGVIMTIIMLIPLEGIRDFFTRIVLYFFGSFRSSEVTRIKVGENQEPIEETRVVSLITHPLHSSSPISIHLPAKIADYVDDNKSLQKKCMNQLSQLVQAYVQMHTILTKPEHGFAKNNPHLAIVSA